MIIKHIQAISLRSSFVWPSRYDADLPSQVPRDSSKRSPQTVMLCCQQKMNIDEVFPRDNGITDACLFAGDVFSEVIILKFRLGVDRFMVVTDQN